MDHYKTLTSINATKLAIGIQGILLDMPKKSQRYPIRMFEAMIMDRKQVSPEAAKLVTEKIILTGILRMQDDNFVL